MFFFNKSCINKLVLLLASCIAQVSSLYITTCMHFCLCESFLCKREGEEKTTHHKRVLHTDCRKHDKTPGGSAWKKKQIWTERFSGRLLCMSLRLWVFFVFNQPPRLWGTGSLGEIKINKLSGWLQVKTQQNIGA